MAACAAARKTIADKMRVRVEKQAARNAGKGATEEQIQALADAEWAEVEPKIEVGGARACTDCCGKCAGS